MAEDEIETLIIDAAECEPYITADDRLMQDCAAQVVEGIPNLAHILQPRETLSALNRTNRRRFPCCARCWRTLTIFLCGDSNRSFWRCWAITSILTGKQVPHGGRSSDIGVLMGNVRHCLRSEVVSLLMASRLPACCSPDWRSNRWPGNVWARLGTPVRHL
ncbi:hypothetical protein ACNKHV_10220 [Shigella flexneri]